MSELLEFLGLGVVIVALWFWIPTVGGLALGVSLFAVGYFADDRLPKLSRPKWLPQRKATEGEDQ